MEESYILEVVRLLGVEVGWSCDRHDGICAEMFEES